MKELKRLKEQIGKAFGQWTVIGEGSKPGYLLCRCKCGTEREVYWPSLKNGKSRSCGCVSHDFSKAVEKRSETQYKNKVARYTGTEINGFKIVSVFQKRNLSGTNITWCTAECPKCNNLFTTRLARIKSIKTCAGCNRDIVDLRPAASVAYTDGTSLLSLKSRTGGMVNKNSSTGANGVSKTKNGTYRAYINICRHQIHLGVYKTLEEAIAARDEAQEKIYGAILRSHDGWEEEYQKVVSEIRNKNKKGGNKDDE